MLRLKYNGVTPNKLQLECPSSDRISMKIEVIPTLVSDDLSKPQAKPLGNVPRSEDWIALP